MAVETEVRRTARMIVRALDEYARASGIERDDYAIFVRINEDWDQIHVVFAARHFPISDPDKQWLAVLRWLEKRLPEIRDSIRSMNLTLRTFVQVEEGGIYGIGPGFVDASEFRAGSTTP